MGPIRPLIKNRWNSGWLSHIIQSPGRKEAKGVQVEVRLDSTVTEPKVVILTDQMTEEVNAILRMLSESEQKLIAGFRDDTAAVLDEKDILRIYAANGKVFAVLPSGEYTLRMRLYEAEERLKQHNFIRISNSEIINLKKVRNFDLSFIGTVCVVLSDGSKTYASRRYVTRLKGVLGI
jgi:DNA-binding LytR/AlgR family response regulator